MNLKKTLMLLVIVCMLSISAFAAVAEADPCADGHVWGNNSEMVRQDATCEEDGWEAYYPLCDVCGAQSPAWSSRTVIPAWGHDWDNGVVVTEPTCTTEGTMFYTCATRGCTKTEKIDKLAHDYKLVGTSVQFPCEGGNEVYRCACGDEYAVEVSPVDHSWGEWKVTVNPACGKTGTEQRACSVCGKTEERSVAALTHDYKLVESVLIPDCQPGFEVWACDCGASYKEEVRPTGEHKMDKGVVTKEPTCVLEGEKTYTCEKCGKYTVKESIPAKGHKPVEVKIASTCTSTGRIDTVCEVCDVLLSSTEVDKLPHDYKTVRIEPNCGSDGYISYICKTCGYEDMSLRVLIPTKGHHEPVEKVVKAPTCTEKGITETYCSLCYIKLATDEVDALGHKYVSEVIAPTCTAKGYTQHTCSVCGDISITDYVDMLLHEIIAVKVVPPTCTEKGYTVYECVNCDYTYTGTYVDEIEHTYSMEAVKPTCTAEGKNIYTCNDCGKVVEEIVPKLPHTDPVHKEAIPATCTTEGRTDGSGCKNCDFYVIGGQKVAKLDHVPGEEVAAVEATCTEAGCEAGKLCALCGEVIEGGKEIPALGHTEETLPAVEATVDATGLTEGKKCSVCGEILVAQEVVDKIEAPATGNTGSSNNAYVAAEAAAKLPKLLVTDMANAAIEYAAEEKGAQLVVTVDQAAKLHLSQADVDALTAYGITNLHFTDGKTVVHIDLAEVKANIAADNTFVATIADAVSLAVVTNGVAEEIADKLVATKVEEESCAK